MTEMMTRWVTHFYLDTDDRTINGLIGDLQKIRDEVPEEYHDSIRVSINGDYDSSSTSVEITYQSPITEAELKRREDDKVRNEAYQRRQYEELKKKFG